MLFQLETEKYYHELAKQNEKDVIIINDRGVLDPTAYCTPESREAIFKMNDNLKFEKLVNTYDMVLHMVTAANGAEEFYTLENNAARSEGIDLAVEIDNRLMEVYSGARNHL